MEKKDIFRNLKFSAITILAGVLLIFVLFSFESNPFKEENYKVVYPNIASDIEQEVRSYEDRTYSIDKYSNLLAHINSASINGLISTNEALDLQLEVLKLYEKRVMKKCNYFMENGGTNFEEHLNDLLNMSSTIGEKKEFIKLYTQIDAAQVYYYLYPIIINNYIAQQKSVYRYSYYDEYQNRKLINIVQNPDNIKSKYMSTNSTLYTVRYELINKLKQLEKDVENCRYFNTGC